MGSALKIERCGRCRREAYACSCTSGEKRAYATGAPADPEARTSWIVWSDDKVTECAHDVTVRGFIAFSKGMSVRPVMVVRLKSMKERADG